MRFRIVIFLIQTFARTLYVNATSNARTLGPKNTEAINAREFVQGGIQSSLLTCLFSIVDVAPVQANTHKTIPVTPIML